ncbi:putative bifunctional diguanylate cyclase/phosphodiesterase [Acidisoma sp.]|uniref:putative bifunctional diguanylate cyclase/phosphodiesterase n=1 Tax=Acidisoma sp. TaxID=1872115 RepID=UPI003B00E254
MSPRGRTVPNGSAIGLPRPAKYTHFFGAGLGIVLGLALLADYGDASIRGRHAIMESPAGSDPMLAACILLLGLAALATSGSRLPWRLAGQSAIGLAFLLLLARLGTSHFAPHVIESLLPFPRPALPPQAAPGPSVFGVASVGSLFLLAAGVGLLQHPWVRTGQILLAGASAGFLVTLLGYAAMLPPFDRPMALFTGLAGSAIALSMMATTAGSGFLRSPAGGRGPARRLSQRLIRHGMGAATFGILLIGGLLARFGGSHGGILMIGEAVLMLIWIWTVGLVLAQRFDTLDRERKAAEGARPDHARDSLTGLLTRSQVDEMLAVEGHSAADAAIIMIDIDRFRSVNNALGTAAGDSLLVQAAKRLANLAEPHCVARAGGDDFAVFGTGIGLAAAKRMAQAVVEIMAVPFPMEDGRQIHVTASVGVAHGPIEGIRDLRHAADEAMHIAKTQGGNQAVPFVSAMHEARIERAGLEQDLHSAFSSNSELFLVYQPIISLRDRRLVAVEALARWRHPRGDIVPPARFVGIAESSGMFLGLGCKLREMAVMQAARWRDVAPGRPPMINLNVSPLELARSDVAGSLGALIGRHGLECSNFCLEVTEGSFADDRALQSLRLARDAGFKIAMDDFGVGYSSLTQLPRLPLTSVKLDRSFLDQAKEGEAGISLLATMVQLAHVLKLPVVAEGVETHEELGIVSDCGCDSVQGFLFSRPLTAQELEPWLKPGHQAALQAH